MHPTGVDQRVRRAWQGGDKNIRENPTLMSTAESSTVTVIPETNSVDGTGSSEIHIPRAIRVLFPRLVETKSATEFDQPKIYGNAGPSPGDGALSGESSSGTADVTLKVSEVAIGDLVSKYDGSIFRRDPKTIWARLQENSRTIPAIEVEFDLNDLTPSERDLAVVGAPVVWTLGYTEGTRRKQSILYIRRIPSTTSSEFEDSRKQLETIVRDIKWD